MYIVNKTLHCMLRFLYTVDIILLRKRTGWEYGIERGGFIPALYEKIALRRSSYK
jgi:hypothetical protein